MKYYYVPNAPQLIWGSSAEREEFFNIKYEELTKQADENDVLLCDAQALFNEFLNALSNATVREWRDGLLSKKYILIDGFHWFETKNIILDELMYIFRHANATIILGTSKPSGEYDFGEDMNRFISIGV